MSAATVMIATAAKILADLGLARMAQDYRDDLAGLADGASAFQLRGIPGGYLGDSINGRQLLAMQVAIKHKLASGDSERAWTEGGLLTMLATITNWQWWESIAGVAAFAGDKDNVTVAIERRAMVISATVTAGVVLNP